MLPVAIGSHPRFKPVGKYFLHMCDFFIYIHIDEEKILQVSFKQNICARLKHQFPWSRVQFIEVDANSNGLLLASGGPAKRRRLVISVGVLLQRNDENSEMVFCQLLSHFLLTQAVGRKLM